MESLKNTALVALILLLVSGCGSVQKYPFARFSTPETNGIGVTRFDTGASKAVRLQPSPDLRDQNVSQEPQIASSTAFFVKPSFGLADSLDIEMYMGPAQAFQTALKWQIWGAPTSAAAAGNISFALRAGYSIYVAAEEINAGEVFGSPRLDRSMVIDSGYSTYEAIAGYRLTSQILFFVGIYKDSGRYNLKFKEGVRDTIIHETEVFGQNFGLQWQAGGLLLTLNGAGGEFEVANRARTKEFFNYGLSVGFLF